MKAWRVHAWGEPESMSFEETPVPAPADGEILIRVRAAALNFFDRLQIQGKYQNKPPFPFTPGAEVAGAVESRGASVDSFAPGDEVLAVVTQGGWAEYAVAPAERAFARPPELDFAEAAALSIVYQTSYFALVTRAALRPGEWLLVHAGASGAGMSAIQIGRALGANVIATAGSAAKLDFAAAQGAQHVVDYGDPGWVDRVKQITGGRGVDLVYDPVGGDVFELSLKCLASEGRLLVIGFASGRIPSVAANRLLLKNASVVGAVWGGYIAQHPGYIRETHAALLPLVAEGRIHPRITRRFRLIEAPVALAAIAAREIMGKAVLLP